MDFIKFIIKKVYLKYKFGTKLDFTTNIRSDIKLEEKVNIGKYCSINCKKIGRYTFIGDYTKIDASTTNIGMFCSISSGVYIGATSHPSNYISTHTFCYNKFHGFVNKIKYDEFTIDGKTNIGNDVLISANSIILAGVTIGDGAIIGAGSVVTKDVESYTIVAGVPAKMIRYRFDKDTIEKLLNLKWWSYELEYLKNNIDLFDDIKNLDKLKMSNT